jgi:hypothetical protein
MAKTKKPLIYLIYSDLVSAVNGIGKKTYLDRPKSGTEELANFIVVDIPTEIRGMVKGSVDFKADCYGTFSVFCKAKTDATINIGSQSELTQKVLDLFPINGKYITASRPRVLMQGEDGYGYQVTQITFSLHTKTNARNID